MLKGEIDVELRPFNDSDFDVIKDWITDPREHAMWCANIIQYPIDKENFYYVMSDIADRCDDSPYVVTLTDGSLAGFFCYSVNKETNEGMLKFVIIDPELRGKGYGKEMLKIALEYAFYETKADAVQLNVFSQNTGAVKCYKSIGFVERKTDYSAFGYKDGLWDRCNMVIKTEVK